MSRVENRLSETDRLNIQEVFLVFAGSNDSGVRRLDFHELMCAMRALGFEPSKKDVLSILERCDPHAKRYIDQFQFEKEMGELVLKRDPLVEIERAYKLFAADGELNGRGITFESLKAVARDLGEDLDDSELHAMVDEFDLNDDGRISLDEFIRICER